MLSEKHIGINRGGKMKEYGKKLILPIFVVGSVCVYLISQNTLTFKQLIYGDLNAPIEIVNYTSFQCPPCANFHWQYGDVLEKYLDSGDIKLVVKAVDLDKFEYDEVIYQHLTEEYLTDYRKLSEIYAKQGEWYDLETKEEVIQFLDLNETSNGDLKRQIKQNSKERVKLGIKGVPTTLINGEELELGISAEALEAKILSLIHN